MLRCPLNDDIWYHVLNFLSHEDLERTNSCHHVLFEGWMRFRYTSVKFTNRDKAIRLLEHLCDPSVAAYVKKVEIRPWLVQLPYQHDSSSARFSHIIQQYYTTKSAKERLQRRVNEDVARVKAAFKQMQNVMEYTIDWDNSFYYHSELYTACLTSGLHAWSEDLVKLTVNVPPAMLNSFARINLPNLESFNFQFSTGPLSFKEINVATDGFMVFLNNLKDSLRSLTFSSTHSSQDLDLSRIFSKMGRFPLLSKIALSIPADGSHLSDPMTFMRFLEKHRLTLEEINLLSSQAPSRKRPNNCGAIIDWRHRISGPIHSTSMHRLRASFSIFGRFMDQHNLSLKEMNLFSASRSKVVENDSTNWAQRVAGYICSPFPQLRDIVISLCPFGGPLDNLINFIETHSATLDSLSLLDRALSHSDVLALFRSSTVKTDPPIRITQLHLRVDNLSSDFLTELVFLLPGLKSLRIECNEVSNSDSTSDIITDLLASDALRSGWGLHFLEIVTSNDTLDDTQTLTIHLFEEARKHLDGRPPVTNDSVSSLSSFATAKDTMRSSLTSQSVSSMISDTSNYSVASSRTDDTDYGRFYTRMALSQTSNLNNWDSKTRRSRDQTADVN